MVPRLALILYPNHVNWQCPCLQIESNALLKEMGGEMGALVDDVVGQEVCAPHDALADRLDNLSPQYTLTQMR